MTETDTSYNSSTYVLTDFYISFYRSYIYKNSWKTIRSLETFSPSSYKWELYAQCSQRIRNPFQGCGGHKVFWWITTYKGLLMHRTLFAAFYFSKISEVYMNYYVFLMQNIYVFFSVILTFFLRNKIMYFILSEAQISKCSFSGWAELWSSCFIYCCKFLGHAVLCEEMECKVV